MALTESTISSGGVPSPARPVFFMSHAVPADTDGTGEDEALFARFFEHLCEAVAARMTLPHPPSLGYMVNAASSERQTPRALAVCRVFVPLWSPLYFTTARCGREWSVFMERVQSTSPAPFWGRFAPVIWSPVSASAIPRAAREVNRGRGQESRPDAVDGLYALMPEKRGPWDPAYRQVVHEVADAVARAAREPLRSAALADLEDAPDAFQQRSPDLSLRVAILAPTTRTLPQGRSGKGRYGADSLDWAPYGNRRLAEDVATVTERLGYGLHLVSFGEVAGQMLADPPVGEPEPTLLLIDNWSLLDESRRRQVEAYVRLDRPWYTFMVVRDREDPETREHTARLQAVVDETLSARLGKMSVVHRHAASGNGSPEGFPRDFSLLAQVAESSFIRR